MNCLVRKLALKALNSALDERKTDVQKAARAVELWTRRAKAVCAALESLSEKVSDGKVTQEEAEAAAAEIRALLESWRG